MDIKDKVQSILSKYDYPEFQWVSSRPSIADLFKPDKRCGIYILKFSNDFFYVGQAVDVTRRYVQHSKVHDDIQEITFKTFKKDDLNYIEAELIKIMEAKDIKLRNINLTSTAKGDTDLDLIVSKKEQENWLNSDETNELNKHLLDLPDHQIKYSKRFEKLIKKKDYFETAKPFLIEYFKKCVLKPEITELSFWVLTALNKAYTDVNNISLCRFNVFWCETLTIWINDEKNIAFDFHLTKSLLSKKHLNNLSIDSLRIINHYYEKGGPDQIMIQLIGLNDALKFLSDKTVTNAIKTFNLRQMQKGATVYGKYHCIDLAKDILASNI